MYRGIIPKWLQVSGSWSNLLGHYQSTISGSYRFLATWADPRIPASKIPIWKGKHRETRFSNKWVLFEESWRPVELESENLVKSNSDWWLCSSRQVGWRLRQPWKVLKTCDVFNHNIANLLRKSEYDEAPYDVARQRYQRWSRTVKYWLSLQTWTIILEYYEQCEWGISSPICIPRWLDQASKLCRISLSRAILGTSKCAHGVPRPLGCSEVEEERPSTSS